MNCEQAAELLQDDLDGRLDPAAKAGLGEHVAACEACTREAAELSELRRLFQAVPPVTAPAGFADGVLAALPEAAPPARILRMPRWAAPLVALAAVALIAVTLSTENAADRPAETSAASAPAGVAADQDGLERMEEGFSKPTRRQAPEAEKNADGSEAKDEAPPRARAAKKSRAPAPEPVVGGARAEGARSGDAGPDEGVRDAKSKAAEVADALEQREAPGDVVVAFRDRAEAARFKVFLERRAREPADARDDDVAEAEADAGDTPAAKEQEERTAEELASSLDALAAARAQLLATVDVDGDVRALVAAYDRGNPEVLDADRARAVYALLAEEAAKGRGLLDADDEDNMGPGRGGGGGGALGVGGGAGADKSKRAKGEADQPTTKKDAPTAGRTAEKPGAGGKKSPAPAPAPEAKRPAADPAATAPPKGAKARRVRVVIVILEEPSPR